MLTFSFVFTTQTAVARQNCNTQLTNLSFFSWLSILTDNSYHNRNALTVLTMITDLICLLKQQLFSSTTPRRAPPKFIEHELTFLHQDWSSGIWMACIRPNRLPGRYEVGESNSNLQPIKFHSFVTKVANGIGRCGVCIQSASGLGSFKDSFRKCL